MSNYLRRVITAGARIHSLATPPPAAPAVLPVAAATPPPHPLETRPAEQGPAVPESREAAKPAGDKSAATPAPSLPAAAAQETPKIAPQRPVPLSVAIARMTSGTRIQAPKALRPSRPAYESRPDKMSKIEAPSFVPAVTSRNIPDAPPAAEPTMAGEEPVRIAVPAPPAAAAPAAPDPTVEQGGPRAEVPPMSDPAPPPPRTRTVRETESRPSAPKAAREKPAPRKAEPGPVVPLMDVSPPRPMASAQAIEKHETSEGRPRESTPLPAASSAPPEPHGIRIKPRPAEPAAKVVVQERGNTPKSLITIGKVDVQVNNQRPQQILAPARAPAGARSSNFLETRYLSRFPMTP